METRAMNCLARSNRCLAPLTLSVVLLAGACWGLAGCTAPIHTAGRNNPLSVSKDKNSDLAKAVQKDPFPSAAQSGIASAMSKAR